MKQRIMVLVAFLAVVGMAMGQEHNALRREAITTVSGPTVEIYSCVVGSFGIKTNAEALQQLYIDKGFNVSIGVTNKNPKMYRVIVFTSTILNEVVAYKEKVEKLGYTKNAWLLENTAKTSQGYAQNTAIPQTTPSTLPTTTEQTAPSVPNPVMSSSVPANPATTLAVSAVDKNIPRSNASEQNTFAVIIGNEQYENEANVPYAENDARVFREYVQKTLGVPEKQIRYVANGGLNSIRMAVRWLTQAMEVCGGQGRAIFYYAGHGIPDEANKTAYLLPVDGMGSDVESGYALDRLYKELSKCPAKGVVVFLDACFSGTKREGDMIASARGVAIKVKPSTPQGNMVVFTASQGDETAYPYQEQGHGMFTYYLLKKLQDTKGKTTLGELGDYLTEEVKRQSFVENSKVQTPTVTPSESMGQAWRSMTLK